MSGRRPLVVDATEALRSPGVRRPLRHDVVLGDLALSSVGVPSDAPVVVELTLEAIGAEVVASGRIRAPWQGDCRRCLEPVVGEIQLDLREVFERQPTEGETYPIGADDELDLEPMVREAVLLALPLSPVCRADCRGPDPERFPAAPDAHSDGGARDPRWAALDELRLED